MLINEWIRLGKFKCNRKRMLKNIWNLIKKWIGNQLKKWLRNDLIWVRFL